MDYDDFKAHGIWAEAEAVSETIDDISLSDEMVPVAARAEAIAGHVLSFRTSAHAALLSDQMLSAPVSHLANVRNYLGNGRYDYADRELDNVLGAVTQWGTLLPPAKQAEQARAATEAMTKIIENQLRRYAAQEKRFTDEATALVAKVDAASARLTEVETLAATTATKHQEAFQEAELQRSDEQKKALADARQELQDMLDSATDDAARRVTAMDDALTFAEGHLSSVEKVVGKTAAAVLARDHGTYANREFAFGLVAYAVGIGGIIWGANVVLGGLVDVQQDAANVTWQWLAAKLSVGAIIGAGSTVAFSLGGRFIKSSSSMKRRELELRAIIPFLAEVDAEKAEDAKLAFLDRTFGREPEKANKNEPADDTVSASFLDRLTALIAATNRAS